MSILVKSIFSIISYVLAGVGVSELLDKFIKPKVPLYYPDSIFPGWKPLKLVWIIIAFIIAILAVRFIGKKTKITFLK